MLFKKDDLFITARDRVFKVTDVYTEDDKTYFTFEGCGINKPYIIKGIMIPKPQSSGYDVYALHEFDNDCEIDIDEIKKRGGIDRHLYHEFYTLTLFSSDSPITMKRIGPNNYDGLKFE